MLDRSLAIKLDIVCQRQRKVSVIQAASGALIVACLVFIIVHLITRWFSLPAHFPVWVPIVSALLAYVLLRDRSHSRLHAARLADRALGLQERLGTAVEFSFYPPTGANHAMLQRLHQDAANHADAVNPKALVPYRLPRSTFWLVPLAVGALAVGMMSPGPSPRTGGDPHLLNQTLDQKGRTLQDLAASLQQEALEQENLELLQLSQLLRDLADKVQRGELTEAELADELARLEDGLNAALDVGAPERDTASGIGPEPQPNARPTPDPASDADPHRDPQAPTDADDSGPGDIEPSPENGSGTPDPSTAPGGSDDADSNPGGDSLTQDDPDGESVVDLASNEGLGDHDAEADEHESPGPEGDSNPGGPDADPGEHPDLQGQQEQLRGAMSDDNFFVRQLESFAPPAESAALPGGPAVANESEIVSGDERSVEREAVPPALRRWVQLYFENLQ